MYWQPESECMDREELAQLQLERLESTLNRVYLNVPFYKKKFDEHRLQSRRPPLAGRPAQTSLHHEERPAGELSLRSVRGAAAGSGPRPRVVGDHGHVHCCRLFAERHQDLVEPGGAHPGRGRHYEGRRDPDLFQLRPVHRRLRAALRGRAPGRLGHPHFERQYPAPDPDHAGLQDHGARGNAELRHADGRYDDGDGY